MRVSIDTANQAVRSGESAWPFRLDVRQGCAIIVLGGVEYRVRPQSWQEKIRMSRFVRLGDAFLRSSLIECCVSGSEQVTGENEQILLALAAWINLPEDEATGLPLDANQLAKVTLEVCRSMSVGPAAIGELAASDVELLWRNLDRELGRVHVEEMPSAPEQFDTKIIVLPDAVRNEPTAARHASAAFDMRASTGSPSSPVTPSSGTRVANETSGTHLSPPCTEVDSRDRVQPMTAHRVEPTVGEPDFQKTTVPRPHEPLTAAPTQPEGRFRVSFNTVNPDARPASRTARPVVRQTIWQSDPMAPQAITEPLALATGDGDRLVRGGAELKRGAVGRPHSVTPELPSGRPAMPTTLPDNMPAAPEADERDIVSAPSSLPETELMETLIAEFCERLDEAATDLGILEEV